MYKNQPQMFRCTALLPFRDRPPHQRTLPGKTSPKPKETRTHLWRYHIKVQCIAVWALGKGSPQFFPFHTIFFLGCVFSNAMFPPAEHNYCSLKQLVEESAVDISQMVHEGQICIFKRLTVCCVCFSACVYVCLCE